MHAAERRCPGILWNSCSIPACTRGISKASLRKRRSERPCERGDMESVQGPGRKPDGSAQRRRGLRRWRAAGGTLNADDGKVRLVVRLHHRWLHRQRRQDRRRQGKLHVTMDIIGKADDRGRICSQTGPLIQLYRCCRSDMQHPALLAPRVRMHERRHALQECEDQGQQGMDEAFRHTTIFNHTERLVGPY